MSNSSLISKCLCLLGLIALMIVGAGQTAQAGPVLTNGSFESTSLSSPGGFFCQTTSAPNNTCTSNVTGWTSTCNSACGTGATPESVIFPGTGGSAFNGGTGLYGITGTSPDGGNFIAVDGDPTYAATISTSVTGLTIGTSYLLSFYEAGSQQKGNSGTTTEQWKVGLNAPSNPTPTFQNSTKLTDASQSFTGWTYQSMLFTATATTETLSFFAVGTPGGGPPVVLLDGVSMQAAPEPATAALIFIGLIAIPLLAERKRQKSISKSH